MVRDPRKRQSPAGSHWSHHPPGIGTRTHILLNQRGASRHSRIQACSSRFEKRKPPRILGVSHRTIDYSIALREISVFLVRRQVLDWMVGLRGWPRVRRYLSQLIPHLLVQNVSSSAKMIALASASRHRWPKQCSCPCDTSCRDSEFYICRSSMV